MSIRQIRLNSTEKIRQRMPEFKGSKINIILTDQTAMMGELISLDEEGIVLENRRLKKNRFLYRDIAELYYDQIV
jgi:hypothetical protein